MGPRIRRSASGQRRGDIGGHEFRNIAAVFSDLFDEMGTGVAEGLGRHHENGFYFRFKVPIHQGHVELKLEIGERA